MKNRLTAAIAIAVLCVAGGMLAGRKDVMPLLKCPNCGGSVQSDGQGMQHCEKCGGSFRWKAGEAKLTGIGVSDRVTALETEVQELKARLGDNAEPDTAEPEAEDDDEDDSFL